MNLKPHPPRCTPVRVFPCVAWGQIVLYPWHPGLNLRLLAIFGSTQVPPDSECLRVWVGAGPYLPSTADKNFRLPQWDGTAAALVRRVGSAPPLLRLRHLLFCMPGFVDGVGNSASRLSPPGANSVGCQIDWVGVVNPGDGASPF